METQMDGFIWILLTQYKRKNYSFKKPKYNYIKNNKERSNRLSLFLRGKRANTDSQFNIRLNVKSLNGSKRLLSIFLSLSLLCVAPVLQVLPVYSAEPAIAHSVWDFMVTELVGANCIITDSAVLNAYGSALGSLNAATATAVEIDAAIATAAAQCGVDLAPVFANTAASAATVGVDAAAASAGENIATTCAGFYAAGEGSAVIPAIGQVLMDAAGIAGIVAGIAYIGKMVVETMGDVIQFNSDVQSMSKLAEMSTPPPQAYPSGSDIALFKFRNNYTEAICGSPVCYFIDGSTLRAYNVNATNSRIADNYYSFTQNKWTYYGFVNAFSIGSGVSVPSSYNIIGGKAFSSRSEIENYLSNIRSGVKSPALPSTTSLASSSGYQVYNPDYVAENPEIQNNGFPEIKPLPDYANGYGLEPITPPSYQALVDAILEVPGNPKYREDQLTNDSSIAEIVQPLISPHIVPLPEVNPNPDPDPNPTGTPDPNPTGTPDPNPTGTPDPNPTGTPDPNPTGTPDPNPTGTPDPDPNPNPKPDTKPFPDPETNPQVTPSIDSPPESEVVPAPVPYPDAETPTEQEKTDTDMKITPIDLRDKFPFCIPFDIVKIMKLFQGGREAPCFTWEIPFGQAGSGSVTVDLSAWDEAASLLRTLELILFIMLLAVGTRNLIGGSS